MVEKIRMHENTPHDALLFVDGTGIVADEVNDLFYECDKFVSV